MGYMPYNYASNPAKPQRENYKMLFLLLVAMVFTIIAFTKQNILGEILTKSLYLSITFIVLATYSYRKNSFIDNLVFNLLLFYMYHSILISADCDYSLHFHAGNFQLRPANYPLQLLGDGIVTAFFAFFFCSRYKDDKEFLNFTQNKFIVFIGEAAIGLFWLCCLAVINIYFTKMFFPQTKIGLFYQLYLAEKHEFIPIISILALYYLVSGVIIEELIFRGILFEILEKYYPNSTAKAFFINNIIFTALHIFNQKNITSGAINLTILFFTASVIWCVRKRTGNIYIPIVLHTFFNVLIDLL